MKMKKVKPSKKMSDMKMMPGSKAAPKKGAKKKY